MNFGTRFILIAALSGSLFAPASAQESPAPPAPAAQPSAPVPASSETSQDGLTQSSHDTRTQFNQLLRQSPSELATILTLDPTLLSNPGFMAGYPELERFVARHPEVRRNPRFYLGDFAVEEHRRSPLNEIVEMLSILSVLALIAFALSWLVRAIIEQKRWNRLSRTQSEVHNKILDRFSTSEELLSYIKTPAGTKFLESAPIPLRAEQPLPNAPLARIMWSVQAGIVIVAGGLGMLLVSMRFEKEAAEGLFSIGAIAACVGAGFIISAAASMILSRRLGLWSGAGDGASALGEPGGMR